jgi:DNA-binding LytR/AlgR family response regulator
MTARNYWIFTLVFWLAATVLLFLNLNEMQMGHWRQVSFRFFYIPVLGILLCAAQTLIFQADGFRKLRYPQPWVVLMACLAAFLTALTLNLITYLLLNLNPAEHQRELLRNGSVVFFILYLFWSFIWFQLDGRPLLGPRPAKSGGHIDRLTVEHLGQTVVINVREIEYFAASGDYVEIQLPDRQYLKKATITALENLLDPAQFQRIHRSTIVNILRVESAAPSGSGVYELRFASGRKVKSSRSYLTVVQNLNK